MSGEEAFGPVTGLCPLATQISRAPHAPQCAAAPV